MNECDIIQAELSAYVDGELTPHRRELVEAHLSSCQRCQEALGELKTIVAGVAEMPKLPTPPRFLAEVRRKIARGDNPEALTWRDYLFQPFWVKVPLELAALVAITVFVMRQEERQPVETVVSDQFAQAEDSGAERSSVTVTEVKPESTAAPEAAPTSQPPPPPAAAPDDEVASGSEAKTMPLQEAQPTTDKEDESAGNGAREAVSGGFQLSGVQAKTAVTGGGVVAKPAYESRRTVAAVNRGSGSPGILPMPSSVEVSTLARSVGIEPSKVSGVVVVHSRDLNNVQGRAEQLAARCNGRVISVSSSTGATDQIFFVEVPREYVASFKLDLEQNAPASMLVTNELIPGLAIVTTNATLLAATSTARVVGVLTGGVETNGIFNTPAQLALANNPRAQAAATTVLEILVVAPPSLAPTNVPPIRVGPAN